MKTYNAPVDVENKWVVIDATDVVVGRLASYVAKRLRGKHRVDFTPHIDTGDHVVIINAEKAKFTGKKLTDKIYYRHTGYPGGIYETNFLKLQQRHPQRVLQKAVRGMLPKGPLGYAMLSKLKVYGGATHPHSAQQPKPTDLLKA